jgi:beta-lactamase class A
MDIDGLKESLYKELAGCSGRASLFLEIEGNTIEFNCHQIYQSASLIKLPIFYEALRQIDRNIISPLQRIIVIEKDKSGDTGILQAMNDADSYSFMDLTTLMIIVSDNSATNMIIDQIGMGTINKTILHIGMKNTILQRRMMDFESIYAGRDNFTTASDIVCCLKEAIIGTEISIKGRKIFLSVLQKQQFRGKLPVCLNASNVIIGNKTGELPGVEHDCAVITYGNKKAYIAVLIDQLPDSESGKSTIRRLGMHLNSFISGIST